MGGSNSDVIKDNETPLLEVKNLVVHYVMDEGVVEAVNEISFTINKGETLGLVGETGAGKTTVALSIMRLLPSPRSHIVDGAILLNGINLFDKNEKQMEKIRGKEISMIFQDPMTALNPVHKVGEQIAEIIGLHNTKSEKINPTLAASEMIEVVGIPIERFDDYPHQFSGGMKQRVVIAMALACKPGLIIADEPTTALDVTIQAQVLELMKELKETYNTSMLMITHDFGVVAEICDKCAVMYAGEIIESGTVDDIFNHTVHPYTIGLFNSLPSLDERSQELKPIKGLMADPMDLPTYCTFAPRCDYCDEKCMQGDPTLREISAGHYVKCFMADI